MKVKFNIMFPTSMYINGAAEPTWMRTKNIQAFKRVTGLGLREAQDFVESCESVVYERDFDDYDADVMETRTIILTAAQWGVLHLLRENGECSFFAKAIVVLDYEMGSDVTDFSSCVEAMNH